jgi:uncharacterized membrane protein
MMENNKIESWIWIIVIGFFIIIGGIGGMFYINNVYIPEQEDIIVESAEMRKASIKYLDDWESAWDMYYDMGIEAEENIESARGVYNGLPFVILIGVAIMFFGFLAKYKSQKQDVTKPKVETHQEEDAIEILTKRYAKGEITKTDYEQMKEDIIKEK